MTLPPLGSARRDSNVRSAFLAALSAADDSGAFGRDAQRSDITVALLCGDMSDAFLLRGIRALNPATVVTRFLEEDTRAPFLDRLASLPEASRAKTLVELWEALMLDSEETLADEARVRGVTAFDIEKLVACQGRAAIQPVTELMERHAFGEAWYARGTPEFQRWGAGRPAIQLASSAAFVLPVLGLRPTDVPPLQRLIGKRVTQDRALECAPTLAENVARVLHTVFPGRFPKTVMGPKNHLVNPEPFLAE